MCSASTINTAKHVNVLQISRAFKAIGLLHYETINLNDLENNCVHTFKLQL
jgi:hypothetical protein